MVMGYKDLWVSYGNTLYYTITGTVLNLIFTCLAAYPLSRKQFFLRRKLNFLLAFTMYFSGGLIPMYLVVTGLGLYNSRLSMILPVLVSAYNVMICRSAFEGISEELFENLLQIRRKISVGLLSELAFFYGASSESKPTLGTLE